jgi:flagellar biogenesis protein FliO
VSTALGLVGVVVFVACVITFAAAVTWLVVRLSPARSPASKQTEAS